ncbi:MAG: protoporphyrinogen oxidase [Pirellulaceae bacterium]
MNVSNGLNKKVAVIGGGISGLSTAHRFTEIDPGISVTLFEQADKVGGLLRTRREDGFLFEWGADNFITTMPWAVNLCRRIGFEDQLVETDSRHRGAFVMRNGKLRRIPQGFIVMAPSRIWPVVVTPILSPWAKLRMASEVLVPKREEDADESLAAFVSRRFGRETYERLVQPLIGGIYTGDPSKLSVQATMPRFREMEKKHGSLIRAVMRQVKDRAGSSDRDSSGGRYSMFVAPRDGVSSLIEALANRLPRGTIRLNAGVTGLKRERDGGWLVSCDSNGADGAESERFDAVVVATPAKTAAQLVKETDDGLAENLAAIDHSGCVIVSLAYDRSRISHPMDGFGFVVPAVENRQILSGSFSSVKYPGRAPEGKVLMRVFIGGALQPELLELPDDRLVQIASDELASCLGIQGGPLKTRIARLPCSMPQYYVGHRERVTDIRQRARAAGGLFITGNALEGVGMPYCVHSGERTAERAAEFLEKGAKGQCQVSDR